MADTTAPDLFPGTRHPAAEKAVTGARVDTEILSGADALGAHLWEWRDLAAAARGVTIFQTPEFFAIWQTAFLEDKPDRLKTVLIRQKGGLAALVPVIVSRLGPLKIVRLAGFPIGQYDDILVRPAWDTGAVLTEIASALRKGIGADVLMFDNVRQDSALNIACNGKAMRIGAAGLAPYAEFEKGRIDAFTAGVKKKIRKHLTKSRRDLEEIGAIEFAEAQDPEEAAAWMGEALQLKRQWLQQTGRVSRAFIDRRTTECLTAAAGNLCSIPGPVHGQVSRLTVAGRTAAIEFGFIHRKAYHSYLGAFAPEFARHSPGNLLTEALIPRLAEAGITRYDMLAPDARYKREWATATVSVQNRALALSPAGWIYLRLFHQAIMPACRWLFYRLPVRWRGFAARKLVRG